MRKIATLAAVAALTLTGCATTESTGVTEDKSGSNAASETEKTTDPAPKSEAPKDDGTAKFGQTYEWSDGLSVRISKPKKFQPDQWAVGKKGKNHVMFNVKIVNNTGAPFDAAMFSTTMQSGNAEASEIYDTANGFDGAPMTKILDGRESQFKIGYSVQNPEDLVLEVSPSFEHQSVLFVTK